MYDCTSMYKYVLRRWLIGCTLYVLVHTAQNIKSARLSVQSSEFGPTPAPPHPQASVAPPQPPWVRNTLTRWEGGGGGGPMPMKGQTLWYSMYAKNPSVRCMVIQKKN
jgi:hypothetical protein